MTKYLYIVAVVAALWFTRPNSVIPKCEQINTVEMCNIINAE